MDIHDIRYLHGDSLAEKKTNNHRRFALSQRSLAGIVLVFLVAGISLTVASISRQTSTQSSAKREATSSHPSSVPIPTVTETQLEGTITCLPTNKTRSSECDIALKTKEGTYLLQNVLYEDVVSGTIVPGKKVTLTGTIETSQLGASGGTLYIKNTSGGENTVPSPTLTKSVEKQLTVTPTMTITPTPTPIPHYVDSTPQPGVVYLTIKYIRDNAQSLLNTQVHVGAYLVGGFIGEDGCTVVGICTYSSFILADTNDPNRDQSLDMEMKGNSGEKEEDYTTGQNYYHEVKVIDENGTIKLEKTY